MTGLLFFFFFVLNRISDVVDYSHFLPSHVSDAVKEMDPQIYVASKDYLSFTTYKPLPFLRAGVVIDLGGLIPLVPPYERLRLLCWSTFCHLIITPRMG